MSSETHPAPQASAPAPPSWRRLDARRSAWAAALSLIAHVTGIITLSAVATAPSIDLDFELPAEVEFGLTEGMVASAAPAAAPAQEPPGAADSNEGAQSASMDAGRPEDAGPRDAGSPHDAGRPRDAGRTQDAGPARDAAPPRDSGPSEQIAPRDAASGDAGPLGDAGRDGALPDGALPDGEGRIPPGAQLAIRLNMERLRASPLAPEVGRLLTSIPDWHALLDGSGIDPMADLDRLLLASPNLQRERLVLAGRHHRDQAYAVAAAERLAASQHRRTSFRDQAGVRVAPWQNPDRTERVIALAGDHHFIICRPQDLPRVLALMRIRAEDQRSDAGAPVMTAADALLAMGDEELMSFEIEGARRFVRRGRVEAMPLSGRLSVRDTEGGAVRIAGQGRFDDGTQARAARDFWREQVETLSHNPMVSLVGLSAPLRRLSFRIEGDRVHFETSLGAGQVRLLLGYLEGLLVQYRRDREARRRAAHPRAATPQPLREPPPAHAPDAGRAP